LLPIHSRHLYRKSNVSEFRSPFARVFCRGVANIVTASNQLARLVKEGILRKEGKGRGTRYFLAELTFKN